MSCHLSFAPFITANNADITVGGNTNLKGSLIAAGYYDENGNFIDNGNLNLTTNTLTFSNLNSTSYSTNTSVGGGVSLNQNKQGETLPNASSVTYDASSGISYSKEKTLATIGSGNLTITDKENSDDITKLNRNTDNLTKELYSGGVSSDVSATIDTRMFTEDGRKDIAEDFYRSGEFIDATAEVITNEGSAGEQGFFTHTGNVNDNIEINKQFTNMEEGKYALILNNLDSATPEQKQEALSAYAQSYSNVTGVSIEDALIIATNKFIGGASHNQKGTNTIYINDESQNNALDYIGNATHEVTHGQIDQGLLNDLGDEKNEAYANLMGEHGSDNFEWAYGSSQYTIGSALNYGDINAHIDNDTSTLIADNNQQFIDVLKNDGENVDYLSVGNFNGFDKATKAKLLSCQQSGNISTLGKYNIQGLTNNGGKSYEGFVLINPNSGEQIILLPYELAELRLISNKDPKFFDYYMTKIENTSNTQHILNSPNQDGFMGQLRDSWSHYVQSGEIVMDLAGFGLGGITKTIGGKVIANNADNVIINSEIGFSTSNLQSKLKEYLLNVEHPQNQTKATWFKNALGFDQSNWQSLANQLKFNENVAIVTKTTEYGTTFNQTIPIVGTNGKTIDVLFVFIKDNNGVVKFVTGIPSK